MSLNEGTVNNTDEDNNLLSSKDEREKEKPAPAQEEALVIGGADADAFNEKGTKKWTPEQEGFLLSTYNSELAERTGAGGPNTAISMTPLWNAVCKTFNSDSRGKQNTQCSALRTRHSVIVSRFKNANELLQRDIKCLAKDDACPYEDANGKAKTGKPLIDQRIFCSKRYHDAHELKKKDVYNYNAQYAEGKNPLFDKLFEELLPWKSASFTIRPAVEVQRLQRENITLPPVKKKKTQKPKQRGTGGRRGSDDDDDNESTESQRKAYDEYCRGDGTGNRRAKQRGRGGRRVSNDDDEEEEDEEEEDDDDDDSSTKQKTKTPMPQTIKKKAERKVSVVDNRRKEATVPSGGKNIGLDETLQTHATNNRNQLAQKQEMIEKAQQIEYWRNKLSKPNVSDKKRAFYTQELNKALYSNAPKSPSD